MTFLAAVLGDPVNHSLSPFLHRLWLDRYGISGHYIPIRITHDEFQSALECLSRLGFNGVNITVPLKEAALDLADEATEQASRIGAANMLTFDEKGIHAHNTDAFGFTWNILDCFPTWQPECVSILGAGGASRAVLAALIDRGAREIRVSNRNEGRAQALAEAFGNTVKPVAWKERDTMLEGSDTLVNATSLGMQGKPDLDIRLDMLPRDALVTDLVYTPLETPLLAAARTRGNHTVDGLGMLLYQAVPAFERWFGKTPKVDQALRKAILVRT